MQQLVAVLGMSAEEGLPAVVHILVNYRVPQQTPVTVGDVAPSVQTNFC